MIKFNTILSAFFFLVFCEVCYAVTITWNGSVNTDWHLACNWSTNTVPTCSDDVIIPNGVTNKPIITGVAHCKTAEIQTVSSVLLTINIGSGGQLEIGSCPSTIKTSKIVFVSSVAQNSTATVSSRNSRCNTDASNAGICGSFKAWIAVSGGNNVPSTTNITYNLPSGTKVADDWTDLTDGSLDNAINQYADATSAAGVSVLTGLNASGNRTTNDCVLWSDASSNVTVGSSSSATGNWTNNNTVACGSPSSSTTEEIYDPSPALPNPTCASCFGLVVTGSGFCGLAPTTSDENCNAIAPPFATCTYCGTISYNPIQYKHYCVQQ